MNQELFDYMANEHNVILLDSDIKEIIKELSEIELTDEAVKLLHKKATRFRQITNYVDKLEKVASANEITEIDETIVNEVLKDD